MEKHSTRKHALLSASGAERWLNCTPSARLEDEYGVKTTSIYAEEGTTAHELGDLMLVRDVLGAISETEYVNRLSDIMNKDSFNDEMLDEVPKYTDYCQTQFNEAKQITADALFEVEQKIDLTAYIPDGYGTCDCSIIADGTLEVIDLKYGKGVSVSATANKQLMLYGLGALLKYNMMYEINTVRLTIVQPRTDNISSWSISADELIAWADDELRDKALIADAGKGELNVGPWCKFCSVKNRCTKLSETNLEIAKYDFAKPQFLTDAQIADIVKKSQPFIEWVNSITEYALNEAFANNKVWPGFKLVEGQSRRKWVEEQKVVAAIHKYFPGCEDDDIFESKLKSITEVEKLVTKKKFNECLGDVVIKPQGKPMLVADTDPRPAFGISQAKSDFK